MAPVAVALRARGLEPLLVLTGQQAIDIGEHGLCRFEQLALDCPGQVDPDAHVDAVAKALRPHLARRPRLSLVQGDTSSAAGAARAAFAAGISVGHVEAGLRTHDFALPWPEEGYRVAIDAQAELLFAPSEHAARNLISEEVPGEIHVTGNSGIDALLAVTASLPTPSPRKTGFSRMLVTCHRRESWGSGLHSIAAALIELAETSPVQIHFILHPNRHVAVTMERLLGNSSNIRLIEPCRHAELVRLMRDADLILSDSGGIQEEAPALGTPLLVLRTKTERPEVIASGNALLVGPNLDRIVAEVKRLLDDPAALAAMARPSFPYGTGDASVKIAAAVETRLRQSAWRAVG